MSKLYDKQKAINKLKELNVNFEITTKLYGRTIVKDKKIVLRKVYVDRFIHDQSYFNSLGFGLIMYKELFK